MEAPIYPPPLRDETLVFFDVETTGLNPAAGHRIVEVALAVVAGGRTVDSFETLVNPRRPIPADTVRIHGIDDRKVAQAPPFEAVAPRLERALEGGVLIAHNARFDVGFLAAELAAAGRPMPAVRVVDTLEIARTYYNFPSYRLAELAESVKVSLGLFHRAAYDVATLKGVFDFFVSDLVRRGVPPERFFRPRPWSALLDAGGTSTAGDGGSDPCEAALRRAIERGAKVEIVYVSARDGEMRRRVVEPRRLFEGAGRLYVSAFCHLRGEERSFRVDRIVEVRVLE